MDREHPLLLIPEVGQKPPSLGTEFPRENGARPIFGNVFRVPRELRVKNAQRRAEEAKEGERSLFAPGTGEKTRI